tara:strand:+ start:3217 stop:3444 length:228 start_codon:yes stop_codon:yes gene_type:complete
MPTVLLYWQVFRNAQSKQERLCAKSYLWAKVSSTESELDSDKVIAKELLGQVLNRMPNTWLDNLDKTISDYLAEH